MSEFVTPIRILRREYLSLEPPHSPNQKEIARGLRDFDEFIQVLANRIGVIWQTYGKDWIGQSEFFRWRNALLKASKNISLKDLELRKKTYFAMLKTNSVQSKWMVLSVLCTPQEILLT